MKKILYVVLDGLGDRECPQFGGKTPLEAAETPNLDSLATKSRMGIVQTVGEGIAPESDIAVISILGYDAKKYYTGRGPLESYAVGLEVRDGDLAYRANFATLGDGRDILDRRVGRSLSTEEAGELSKAINEKLKLISYPASFRFKNTVGHRAVLVFYSKNGKLSGEVTNTDPAYGREGVFGVAKETFEDRVAESKPIKGCKDENGARHSSLLTNEFTRKSSLILNSHPVNKKRKQDGKLLANLILLRDAGDSLPKFPPIESVYGVKFGCFVEMPVERGIALLTGMQIIELPSPSGELSIDYRRIAELCLGNLSNFGGLYIHIKGPDEPAHDGNAFLKKEIIEKIDKFFFGNILGKADLSQTVVAVTADHSTPCSLKAHSEDPVPLLITSPESDGRKSFSEKEASLGSLGKIKGTEVLPLIVRHGEPRLFSKKHSYPDISGNYS